MGANQCWNSRDADPAQYLKEKLSEEQKEQNCISDEFKQLREARTGHDLEGLISLMTWQTPIGNRLTSHPWVEAPDTIGALAISYVGQMVSDVEYRHSEDTLNTLAYTDAISKLLDLIASSGRPTQETSLIALSFITDPTTKDRTLQNQFLDSGGYDILKPWLYDEKEAVRAVAGQIIRNSYLHKPVVMKKVTPYMEDMVAIMANFTEGKYLREHVLNIIDYWLDSKEEILSRNVSILRDFKVKDQLAILDKSDLVQDQSVSKAIQALRNALSHTTRLWDLNLNLRTL